VYAAGRNLYNVAEHTTVRHGRGCRLYVDRIAGKEQPIAFSAPLHALEISLHAKVMRV
jgi:hypothetical protein